MSAGFVLELEASRPGLAVGAGAEEGALAAAFCDEVRGFQALAFLAERGDATPARLVLGGLDADDVPWLRAWSEDERRVERTIRVTRLADGASLTVVATLAVFGRGVDTALSVGAPATRGPAATRSASATRSTSLVRPPLESGVFVTAR